MFIFILNLIKRFLLKKHQFETATLIHRRIGKVIFEVEFNWYDENLNPVSVIREVHSGKIFSVRGNETIDFQEYSGSDSLAGSTL